MISIPMNKNLFPGDFFSRYLSMHFYIVVCNGISSVPVFLTRSWHCCPLSHNSWCHGSLQREIHIQPVHYGHFGGGKLLMDFKITFKRDGKWLKPRVFSKNSANCKLVNSVTILHANERKLTKGILDINQCHIMFEYYLNATLWNKINRLVCNQYSFYLLIIARRIFIFTGHLRHGS